MRYGFINKFGQTLAADLAAGATTMTLDGGGSLLSSASADLVYALTLVEKDADGVEVGWEIVHVTGASANDLTITRGQEGTADAAWPSGTTVELRLTAASLNNGLFDASATEVELGGGQVVEAADYGVAIGVLSYTAAIEGVSIGRNASVWSDYAIAIGRDAESSSMYGIALGRNSSTEGDHYASAIGNSSWAGSNCATALGADARVRSSAPGSSALGFDATVASGVTGGLALGSLSFVSVDGGCVIHALPYLPAAPIDDSYYLTLTAANATRRSAPQVALQTDILDLTDANAVVTLDLPPNTLLFIDAIDIVIVGSDAPSGSPEISIGPDDVTPAAYLAATPVGKTIVGERETHAPIIANGVAALRVATSTAGTGTTYQARAIFRGYVMEL